MEKLNALAAAANSSGLVISDIGAELKMYDLFKVPTWEEQI